VPARSAITRSPLGAAFAPSERAAKCESPRGFSACRFLYDRRDLALDNRQAFQLLGVRRRPSRLARRPPRLFCHLAKRGAFQVDVAAALPIGCAGIESQGRGRSAQVLTDVPMEFMPDIPNCQPSILRQWTASPRHRVRWLAPWQGWARSETCASIPIARSQGRCRCPPDRGRWTHRKGRRGRFSAGREGVARRRSTALRKAASFKVFALTVPVEQWSLL